MENKYYTIKNHSTFGESFIADKAFIEMIYSIMSKIKSARICNQKNNHPVNCEIKKDNKIYISIDIAIKKDIDINKTCDEIVDEIKNSVFLMIESKPIVNLNVVKIDI